MKMLDGVKNFLISLRPKPQGEQEFVADSVTDTQKEIPSKMDLLKKLHGYASACQHVIGNAMGGLEIRMYKNGTLATSEDVDAVLSCPITKLTRQDLMYKLAGDLASVGNSYFTLIGGRLEYISADVAVAEWQIYNGIVSAPSKYKVIDGNITPKIEKVVSADDIVHFKYRMLTGSASGRGALEDCILEHETGTFISRFIRGYFKNSAIPGLMVRIMRGRLKEAQFKRLATKIQEKFSQGRAGGTMVVSDGVTAQVIGNSIVDAKSVEVMDTIKKVVLASYGVPIDILDSTNTNRATAYVSQRLFQTTTILPMAWSICYRLTEVFKDFGYRFEPVAYDTIDPVEGDKLIVVAVEKGILTKEQAIPLLRTVTMAGQRALGSKPVKETE